ncbi:uncharacterized protein LOC110880120 isoform X2 [Helianthus annuus]|uniref:uncharacterized protein LOC110880120 isoform X2 n=1 Tax=Helianthus annuus TaxID=4232 RepID=UPI000B8F1F05|nr:uncharacterized protein LOC110880120 isoform X2 [Helianthus annuus]
MLLSDMSGTHTRWKIDPSSLSIFSDLFTQQLASRLVIDGITPPSWLLSPNSNSHSSYLNGREHVQTFREEKRIVKSGYCTDQIIDQRKNPRLVLSRRSKTTTYCFSSGESFNIIIFHADYILTLHIKKDVVVKYLKRVGHPRFYEIEVV